MLEKIKAELLEINATMFNLSERKKQLEFYYQGYEEAKREAAEVEQILNDKIKELEGAICEPD